MALSYVSDTNSKVKRNMKSLGYGEYTGAIKAQRQVDGAVLTNTSYGSMDQREGWHSHENLHICLVFNPGIAQTRKETNYTDASGILLFYHSEQIHKWISEGSLERTSNIEISDSFKTQYNLSENDVRRAVLERVGSKALILRMQYEMSLNDECSDLAVHSLLLDLVNHKNVYPDKAPPPWISRLEELLHARWNERLSLQDMSEVIGIHPITISKNFHRYFGCTLGAYRRVLKIEHGISLIKQGELSLTEIAFLCGFSDQSHFIRVFKQHTGFLPLAFRKF